MTLLELPKMRVAMFVSGFPVTSETFVINQIVGLLKDGHEVDIFALSARPRERVHELVRQHNLLDDVTYLRDTFVSRQSATPHAPSKQDADRRTSGIVKKYADKVSQLIRVFVSNVEIWRPKNFARLISTLRESKGAWSRLAVLRMLSKDLSIGGYDVVHCQFGDLGAELVPLMRSGVLSGHLTVSFRGHDLTQTERFNAEFYADLVATGSQFMPVSNYLRDRLIKFGFPERLIRVVRSGIDCARFERSERHEDTDAPLRILIIARLVEMKGVTYALDAFRQSLSLRAAGPDGRRVELDIVGDGPLRESLQQQSQSLGIADFVNWYGALDHEEVISRVRAADLMWAPSVTAANGEQEGIPNVVKEAMAMGLPVVATQHSGIPELVEDGHSGFLVAERDYIALAEKTQLLLDDEHLRQEMGDAGRRFVEAEYDLPVVYQQLLEAYAAAID